MNRFVYRMKFAGSIGNLKLKEEELTDPSENRVTVAVRSIGLNFADVFSVLGLYKAAPKFDLIPGLEFSGIVTETGTGVSEFKSGDRVFGVTKFGAYASHINMDKEYLIPLPGDWSFNDGAAFPVQALTAYYALKELGNVGPGKTVLVHSAAGGVGTYAGRIAKRFSAYTIGTVGDTRKLNSIETGNYDALIVRGKDLKEKIENILGRRTLDIVLDTLGGDVFKLCFDLLSPMGRIMVYGAGNYSTGNDASNPLALAYKYLSRPKIDPLKMIEKNKAVMAFNLIWLYDKAEYFKDLLAEIMALELPKPLINHRFDFKDLPDAVRTLKSGETTGKVVVEINA